MMSSRLIVDNTNQLQELDDRPRPLLLVAKLVSYIFHPVFIPLYIVLFLLYIHPNVFAGFSGGRKTLVLLQSFVPYILFPVITVLLLKALGFISTVYLKTKKDRIIPYIACNLWYFWIMYVWNNLPDTPRELVVMAAAIFLASVIGMMANIYIKISMHAIAMGVALSFMVQVSLTQTSHPGVYLSISSLIAGLVCSARFIASDHTPKEIYGGLMAGFASLPVVILFV